ncbi:BNR-4 repeat-containing protein [Jejuia pallidilutea]|nr:BNR-4 repeat-containing protein [Jejuia pallidilutea]
MRKTILFQLLLLLLIFPANAQVQLIKETKVTDEALHFWYPNGERAAIYAKHISPKGDCFTVANGYIFFGWYKGGMNRRNLMLSRKKIGENTWKTIQFSDKNTLIVDPKDKSGPKIFGNAHQTITVAVSEDDGKVHILFDHHNDPLRYIVSKKDIAFTSDANFKVSNFERKRNYLTERETLRITYPEINKNDRGELILNYRKGNSHGGSEYMHVYSNGKWSKSKRVIQGFEAPIANRDKNYAYGSPTYANGRFYYAFSVRWDNNRAINEGVYVADAGPTMTGRWKSIINNTSRTYSLPIRNYSPFLIQDPPSLNNEGSNGIPQFAITDNGDMQIGWKSRGSDKKYYYTYTKKKNETNFTRHDRIFLSSFGYGNKFYSVSVERKVVNRKVNDKIVIKTNKPGDLTQTTELEIPTTYDLTSEVKFVHEGVLYLMYAVNANSDKRKVLCYEIDLGDASNNDSSSGNDSPADITNGWFKIKNLETGRYLRAVGGGDVVAASVASGNDKQWRFVKTGNYYNIDSRTTGDGSGILRATGNTIIGTKRNAPLADRDKVWKVNKVSSPSGTFRIELKDSRSYIYNETSNSNKNIRLNTKIGDRSKWILEPVNSSSSKSIAPLSKSENNNESVLIYPNPATNGFTITLRGFDKANVIISNLLGKIVYNKNMTSNRLNITRDNRFAAGMYLVKVISNNNQAIYNSKLVIK